MWVLAFPVQGIGFDELLKLLEQWQVVVLVIVPAHLLNPFGWYLGARNQRMLFGGGRTLQAGETCQ
ncbi:hypothetical protein [Hymenobacter agri]